MAEEFDDIKFEVYSSGSWVDISADVLNNPPPRGTRGIMGNGILDRVADVGQLTFSLDNSASNSQATLGYYSTNYGAGTPVRLSFLYDGRRVYKWSGWIAPAGKKITEGVYGQRRVDITCQDFFALASEYEIKELDYAVNKRIDEAVQLLMNEVIYSGDKPNFFELNTGDETFPTVFDLRKSTTTMMGEFNKLAISELGYIYERGNGFDGRTFVVENRTWRNTQSAMTLFKKSSDTTDLFLLANGTDNMLLANGTDKLLLTETQAATFTNDDISATRELQTNTGENYATKWNISITSRIVDADATSVLYTMESPVLVAAGTTVSDLKAQYRDPNQKSQTVNCIQGTTPVAVTDYKAYANSDGTGTDLTSSLTVSVNFNVGEAEITLTNTGGTDLYTGGEDILFRLRGQGVYVYDTVDFSIERGSNTGLGEGIVNFPMVYFSDVTSIKNILSEVTLKSWNNFFPSVTGYPLTANRDSKNMFAFLYMEPGKKGTFSATLNNMSSRACFVNGYMFEIINKKVVNWAPCLYDVRYVIDA